MSITEDVSRVPRKLLGTHVNGTYINGGQRLEGNTGSELC